jgi:hypothetical protein
MTAVSSEHQMRVIRSILLEPRHQRELLGDRDNRVMIENVWGGRSRKIPEVRWRIFSNHCTEPPASRHAKLHQRPGCDRAVSTKTNQAMQKDLASCGDIGPKLRRDPER